MKKFITALLIIAMLIPMTTFMASAAEIENLYVNAETKVGIPSASNMNNGTDGNQNYHGSNIIPVKEGDVVTIGPVFVDQGYYLTSYGEDGKVKTAKIAYANCKEVAVIRNNVRIVKWTVPAGVAYIRMATSQMFRDSTVVTVNNEFTVEEYFKCMEKQGTNVDYLKGETASGDITNIFPVSDDNFWGRTEKNSADVATGAYVTTPYIKVNEGDVVYFGAAAQDQGYHLTLYDANKKYTTNVTKAYMVLVEDLGRGFGIYAYKMRTGTGYLRIVAAGGVYGDGQQLATINQPFNGEYYKKLFNIQISDEPQRESVLNGKTALFMGDSISYGSGDGASYLRQGKAWAGRIAQITGLQATNASVSGSKVSYINGDDRTKWHYTQYNQNKNEQFDMIVIQGGVNDARHNRAIGEVSDINADVSSFKRDTYAGGLQYLFHNVKTNWPEATYFFIANHRLDGHNTGNAKNMGPYFDKAKELCELYGFVYIDLYNNAELEAKLDSKSTKYMPDTLHINAAGYEIVTPYILEVLEATMTPPAPETEPETTVAPEPETDPATEPVADPETDPATEPVTEPSGGCGSMVNGFAIIAVLTLAGAFISRKRK